MHSQLRALMGESMVEVDEATRAFKLGLEPAVLYRFGEMPFAGQVLRACADGAGFELLPILTLSISYLGDHYPDAFFARGQEAWWKRGVSFACYSGKPTWSLIRTRELFFLPGTQWSMQAVKAQIPDDEQLPSAHVLVYRALVHYLMHGKRWLENFYAPSSDVVDGRPVCVGYNDAGGLDIALARDHMPCYKFGIVTEKKTVAILAAEAEARRLRSQQATA